MKSGTGKEVGKADKGGKGKGSGKSGKGSGKSKEGKKKSKQAGSSPTHGKEGGGKTSSKMSMEQSPSSPTAKGSKQKGNNSKKDPPWDRYVDVGSMAHWTYTQIVQVT